MNKIGTSVPAVRPWLVVLFTLVVTAGTLGASLALASQMEGQAALILFTVPIMLSAYLGGWWAGLLATALSLFAASYFLLTPIHSFQIGSNAGRLLQLLLLVAGIVISVLNEALHRTRRRAAIAAREHQLADKALRASQAGYQALVEFSPEPIVLHQSDRVIFVNPGAVRLFGARTAQDLLGMPVFDRIHPDFRDIAAARQKRAREQGTTAPRTEITVLQLDGSPVDVEAQTTAIEYEGTPALLSTMHDISARKKHEIEVERHRAIYKALSHVNQAIVRRPTRDALFADVCKILVEHGGVSTAFIRWYDPQTQMLNPVASWGESGDVVVNVPVPASGGLSGMAFRERRSVVCNDLRNDAVTLPWRKQIIDSGFLSCAIFPIRTNDEVAGVLGVSSLEADFFEEQEISLLAEAADDISFALDNASREVERQRSDTIAREAAREATDLRRAISQHSLVAITDANGVITFANDRFSAASQYSSTELLGKDHRLVNSGFHSAEYMAHLWATVQSGAVWQGEIRNRARDGSLYWIDSTIVPFLNSDESVRQYMEISTVITERKQAELALRVERDRAQRYLDTAEVILLALDIRGRITLVNRYACAIFERAAEELIGKDFIETCVPEEIRDETRARLAGVHAGTDSSVVLNPIITSSGRERLVEWRNTLLRDSDGMVTGTISSGTDVTERDATVEALRTAEERMRFALQAANVGIWDMDFTTGRLRWSEILEGQYGLQPGTFPGTFEAFENHVHPDDLELVTSVFAQQIKAGGDFTTHHRVIWPNHSVRTLSGAGRVLLDEQGKAVRGIGISLDITDQRVLEAQFQQAQKMEAIGRLAGGVAHDFNNLLTVMLGYCELLLNELPATSPQRADVEEIRKAGVSAAGLTRQLLAFSRKQIISPSMLDLSEVVHTIRPMIERLIGEDVNVLLNLQSRLGCVMADRAQVEQVIMNLAVNAKDAMPTGGVLTIETSDIELDEHYAKSHFGAAPGKYVMLSVSDTGVGMSADVQARLFEPFFTTKEVGKGTGLGMATVHGIVTTSGGSINVYSELGVGTSFKVYFPKAADAGSVPDIPSMITEEQPIGKTILVVEDAEALRELTRRLLERQGYAVLSAANATDAVQLFEANPQIDLLLTDVVMPGASGPDLAAKLMEKRPDLRVIYMSGYTDDAIVQHGVLNPGITLLSKPFTSAALARKIREAFDQPGTHL